jgi:uncharacterized protein YjbI with pentapeptide repeats/serine/threonine protein kinase
MDPDAQRELFRALAARRAGQAVHVDLAGQDLAGLQAIGADLVGAVLTRAVLTHASLAGARMSRANLEGADLRNCDLGGVDLTEANLRFADLTGARIDDAVFAGADLRDACLQGAQGDPLSMAGARLNKGAITRSELRMRDIARLVVRGAIVNEKPSLPIPGPAEKTASSLPPAAVRGAGVATLPAPPSTGRLVTPFPPSFPLQDLALPSSDLIVLPSEDEPLVISSGSVSIVPSLRDLELEARHRLADLEDEMPVSMRAMQRMNALIVEARPSLVPRSSLRPLSSSLRPAPAAAMPTTGDTYLGVTLGEILPGSTTSRTFRGTTADGVRVLAKVFNPEAEGAALQLPAFQRGVRALSRLQGTTMPSGQPLRVAEVFAIASDVTGYVVRDYDNGAISNIVDVAITLKAGLEIFRSICETVAALHREGVLVRSFKPSNILIDGLTPIIGEIDMVDFPALGKARGELAGYDSFVAPEELIGHGSRSPTADVYALGKLVDYLLTGHEPIAPVGSPPLVADRKGTPPILVEIVQRCLAKDPADRYQYVEDLLDDLKTFETNGAKATLQASIRPGALSRLKAGPSLIPAAVAKKGAGTAAATTREQDLPETRPFLAPAVQRAAGALGLLLGALGLSVFYLAPANVDEMEVAQIAVSLVLGFAIWLLPMPKRRVFFHRAASWAAAAAVVYLAQPVRISVMRWQKDLSGHSMPAKEAAVERLARLGRRDFSALDLHGTRLGHIDLGGARFVRTRLSDADLKGAFLAEADFSGADLTGAKLGGTDLRGARLEVARGLGKASCDGRTRFPAWLRCNQGRPRLSGPRPSASKSSR